MTMKWMAPLSLRASRRAALALAACVMAGQACAQAPVAAGDAQRGKEKISMCLGCHGIEGYKASFPLLYSVPMIAGQNAKYIEAALTAYKKGQRSHPTMDAIAGSLSDQDIADVAAYFSNLK